MHFSATLAAVSIMREHLPDLKIRIVNVVELMKLQPQSEHPHGLSDMDFDELFTKNKPVIFAFHAYPWLIHRLIYRRTNQDRFHVRGCKEEGTITTPFDMTVLNDLDPFHLVMDAIDHLPQTGDKGIYLKQQLNGAICPRRFGRWSLVGGSCSPWRDTRRVKRRWARLPSLPAFR